MTNVDELREPVEISTAGQTGQLLPAVSAENFLGAPVADLKGKAVRGGAVTVTAQAIKMALNVASTMFLARLLTPADFGLIGMVTAVTAFVETFKDAGLSTATVRSERLSEAQVSTLFWLNVAVSAGLFLTVAVAAPMMARFYHEPRLISITLAIGATFLLSGLTVQHLALLRRAMQFREVAIVEIISLFVGAVVGIGLAWAGFGYWALVGLNAAASLTTAIAAWIIYPWRPGFPHRRSGVGEIVAFGGNVVALRFVNSFVHNLPNILVGKYLGAIPVGLYQKSYNLLAFAIDQIYGPVAAVALPPLARVQSDRDKFERFFLAGYSIIISCALPVLMVAAVLSKPLILLVLGPQWLGAVELFRWLAIGSIFAGLLNPIGIVLLAVGRANRQVRITVLDSASIAVGYVVGLRYGLEGVAIGFVVVRALTYLPITIAMLHGTGVRTARLLRATAPPMTAALVAGAVGALALTITTGRGDAFATAVAVPLMTLSYLFVLLVLFGEWPFYRDIALELIPPAERIRLSRWIKAVSGLGS